MGKSAPKYATTTFDSGLWGSSTAGESGVNYKPQEWMSNSMNTIGTGVNTALNNMFSNNYENDANFQAYKNNLYNTMGQQYDQMLGNLADRGLMRSSGLQALNNNYAKALQDNVTSLYDNYYNRQVNNLQNAMDTSNSLFGYMTGITGANQAHSNAVSNHEMEAYKADQAAKAAMYSGLAQAAGSLAGAAINPSSLLSNLTKKTTTTTTT